MSCASDDGFFEWTDKSPISFVKWKSILATLTRQEAVTKQLTSNSNPHRRSTSRQCSSPTKKQERHSLPRTQAFSDTATAVDSFIVSTSPIAHSAIDISRQDATKVISSPTKRYVSSFKTLVNSTSSKHPQRVSYVNDSVIILKLSKTNATESTGGSSQVSSKQSNVSTATPTTPPPPSGFIPILKIEGQKRRAVSSNPSLTPIVTIDQSTCSSSTHTMAMGTTSHPSSNPSLFAYRCTITGGNNVRQRPSAETNTNSLFITTERLKSNISSSMRPARQPLTTATPTVTSAYMSSQQPQRNTSYGTRSRIQQDKLTNFKDLYEYPDPFTNCPQDILSKLAQLTKLQLETIDWEKKRRFTKRKPITNGTTQGKDSP